MEKIKSFKVKSKVQWKWLGKSIHGEIKEIHVEPVSKQIKTKKIKRNGSPENPAYLVQSDAGNLALKLHSELQSGGQKKTAAGQATKKSEAKGATKKARPKMFQS